MSHPTPCALAVVTRHLSMAVLAQVHEYTTGSHREVPEVDTLFMLHGLLRDAICGHTRGLRPDRVRSQVLRLLDRLPEDMARDFRIAVAAELVATA